MSTYQCDKVIEGVECCSNNSLYQIDKDRLIASGTLNSFCIVNIDKCVIEKTIKDESLGAVKCFLKLRDNKTILCGCSYGFCFYDMKTEQYKITKKNHNYSIEDLLLIDDCTFLSYSWDSTIKLWKY